MMSNKLSIKGKRMSFRFNHPWRPSLPGRKPQISCVISITQFPLPWLWVKSGAVGGAAITGVSL